MSDTRYIPLNQYRFIHPEEDSLILNDAEQWKLHEIDATAYAKIFELDPKQNREVYTLYASSNHDIQLFRDEQIKKIKRIRLHAFTTISFTYTSHLVELTFENNEKKVFIFSSRADCTFFLDMMKLNAIYESKSTEDILKYDWRNKPHEDFYNKTIKENYQKFYGVIADTLKELLHQHQNDEIYVHSPGVGAADDLYFLRQTLGKQFKFHFVGHDINEDNITKAKEKIPEGYFEKRTLAEMEQFIQTVNEQIKQPACKVFIFSGVLANGVAENKASAIRYLQYACRSADYIILASHTNCLIDSYIAKACGLNKIKMVPVPAKFKDILKGYYEQFQPVYFYKKSTPKERVDFLIKQSKKSDDLLNTLDLAFSADPLQDLTWLKQYASNLLSTFEKLDLSWSYIKPNEMPELEKIIKQYSFKSIIVSPHDSNLPWIKSLCDRTKTELLKRTDSPYDNTPPHSSISSLRRLGLLSEKKEPTNSSSFPSSTNENSDTSSLSCDSPKKKLKK